MHNQLISTLMSVITKQVERFVSNKARAAVSHSNVLLAFLQLQCEK